MSKFEKYATIFIAVCLAIVAAGFACKFARSRGYKDGYADAYASFKPDTEYVEKKIYIDNPVPVEVTPAGKETYPVGTVAQLKRVIDSLAAIKPDTTLIEIPVPMETKLYRDVRDSIYEAQVTGYHATLDWIKVNQKTAYVTVPVPEYKYPKFMLSPSVEAQIIPNAFFASANLKLDFWKGRWQMGIKGGYGGGFVAGQPVHGVVATVNAEYNLIRK